MLTGHYTGRLLGCVPKVVRRIHDIFALVLLGRKVYKSHTRRCSSHLFQVSELIKTSVFHLQDNRFMVFFFLRNLARRSTTMPYRVAVCMEEVQLSDIMGLE
jgi:hypothetical protein